MSSGVGGGDRRPLALCARRPVDAVALAPRVLLDEAAGLGVLPLDVGLELTRLDPPLPAATDLDRGEIAAPDQRIGLGGRDVEHFRDVAQRQEARLARSQ